MDLNTLLAAANFIEYKNNDEKDPGKAELSSSKTVEYAKAHLSLKASAPIPSLQTKDELTSKAMKGSQQTSDLKSIPGPVSQSESHSRESTSQDLNLEKQRSIQYFRGQSSLGTQEEIFSTSSIQHVKPTSADIPETDPSYNEYSNSPKPLEIVDMANPSMDLIVARARMAAGPTNVAANHPHVHLSSSTNSNPVSGMALPSGSVVTHTSVLGPGVPHPNHVVDNPPTESSQEKKQNGTSVSNTLMPSLIKNSEDEKMYAALQFKQMKRNVTLTHNQLEKNRRAHLKERFEALKLCIPRIGMRRSSNLTILKAALRHIETLKKKAADHQQALETLKKEKQEKMERLVALKNELLEQANSKTIDQYLEDSLSKASDANAEDTASVASVTNTAELEDDQQSTSTASEAEEEEQKAKRSRPSQPLATHASRDLVIFPPSVSTHPLPEGLTLESGKGVNSYPAFGSNQLKLKLPPLPKQLERKRPNPINGSQRSPVKLFGTPSGRSATPSPPSNCLSFFPRFYVGSGGSPPLHSSNDVTRAQKLTALSSERTAVAQPDSFGQNSAPVAGVFPSFPSKVFDGYSVAPSSVTQYTSASEVPAPVSELPTTASTAQSRSSSTVVVGADCRVVSLPTFSGYQVKVKYVNPSITVASQTTHSQAHIPMKKRHLDVNSFTPTKGSPAKSKLTAMNESVPKLTSLYVGASATVLGLSNTEGGFSTSDTESDRDSPMFSEQTRVGARVRQWRRNVGKEWTEYRGRGGAAETNRKNNFISYDPPTTNPATQAKAADRPKATFNLWDRKHHAITMTTATNWRGKQQLVTTKSKVSTPSSPQSANNPQTQSAATSSTQVCYTTLREASRTTVPNALVVGNDLARWPPDVATVQNATSKPTSVITQAKSTSTIESQTKLTSPQDRLEGNGYAQSRPILLTSKPVTSLQVTSQVQQVVGGQAQTAVYASPMSVPTNPVAYHILPPHFMTPGGVIAGNGPQALPQSISSTNVVGAPAMGYLVPAPVQEQRDQRQNEKGSLVAPANVQMPYVIPLGYVMYPGNVAVPIGQHGLQLASMSSQGAKALAHPEVVPMTAAQIVYQTMPSGATKRSASPLVSTDKERSRVGSADSVGSSTVSADSIDPDKRDNAKRQKLTPRTQSPAQIALSTLGGQFVVPGNPRYLAANNGSAIPINLLGYPFPAVQQPEGGAIPTVHMATRLPSSQSASNQVWSVNQGIAMAVPAGAQQAVKAPAVTLQLLPGQTDKPS